MKLNDNDLMLIERHTIGQSENPLWVKLRKGRLTASNFYRVFTKVESMKRNPSVTCDALLDSLFNPSPLSHIEHIVKGKNSEQLALEKLSDYLAEKGHSDIRISSCGLYIDKQHQYLGASPDGLLHCCCGDAVIELKCPTRDLAALPYLDGDMKLKKICLLRSSSRTDDDYWLQKLLVFYILSR
jgi:hypothetical protein